MFVTTQIDFSFVLLAGAATVVSTLLTLQSRTTGFDVEHVLAFDIPAPALGVGVGDPEVMAFYQRAIERVGQLPSVEGAAIGSIVPWRDAGNPGLGMRLAIEGYKPEQGEDNPRARVRVVSQNYFSVLGVKLLAGREFTEADRRGAEPVAIISQNIAQRYFPNGEALNRHIWSTDRTPPAPIRIVAIAADVDDESLVNKAPLTVYEPLWQVGLGGRLFVRAAGDPHPLVPAVTRAVRDLSADQPVERGATLEDVRADVLTPERVNAFVFSGFAGIALLIAVVGVAGVLAFSVSARTREFGVRLAVGSALSQLLVRVLKEGVTIAAIGTAAGAIGGFVLWRLAVKLFASVQLPGAAPVAAAAAVLIGAAVVASWMPAARASRIDVLQALRSE